MSKAILKFESVKKFYHLGTSDTGSVSRDFPRWGKEYPNIT